MNFHTTFFQIFLTSTYLKYTDLHGAAYAKLPYLEASKHGFHHFLGFGQGGKRVQEFRSSKEREG